MADDLLAACEAVDTRAASAFDKRMAKVQQEFAEMQRVQSELKEEDLKFQKSLGKLQKELEAATRNLGAAQVKRSKLVEQLKAVDEEVKSLEERKNDVTSRIHEVTAEAERARSGKLSSITGVYSGGGSGPAPSGGCANSLDDPGLGVLGDMFADGPSSSPAPSPQQQLATPIVGDLLDLAGPLSQPATISSPSQSPLDGLSFGVTEAQQQQQLQQQQPQQHFQQEQRQEQILGIGQQMVDPASVALGYSCTGNLHQTSVPCGQAAAVSGMGQCQHPCLPLQQQQQWQQQQGQQHGMGQCQHPYLSAQQQQQWQQQQWQQHGVGMSQQAPNPQMPLGQTNAGIQVGTSQQATITMLPQQQVQQSLQAGSAFDSLLMGPIGR